VARSFPNATDRRCPGVAAPATSKHSPKSEEPDESSGGKLGVRLPLQTTSPGERQT
jgi:hypothetical protein